MPVPSCILGAGPVFSFSQGQEHVMTHEPAKPFNEIEHTNGAGYFTKHPRPDWCHVCGRWDDQLTDVFYMDNAGKASLEGEGVTLTHHPRDVNYIRICTNCAYYIRRIGSIEGAGTACSLVMSDTPTGPGARHY